MYKDIYGILNFDRGINEIESLIRYLWKAVKGPALLYDHYGVTSIFFFLSIFWFLFNFGRRGFEPLPSVPFSHYFCLLSAGGELEGDVQFL